MKKSDSNDTTDYLTIDIIPPQEGISDLLGQKSLPDGQNSYLAVDIVK
jgi:hypothetical protein